MVVDLHADLLWRTAERGKDPWQPCAGEMLDLPRMFLHGPGLQCFTLYTPGDRRAEAATEYAERLHAIWCDLVERGAGRLGWVRDAADLARLDPHGLAGTLTMEGASPLRGEAALLDHFYALGVRSLGLTHNPRNEAGDGCTVPAAERRGLTPFGRELVHRCLDLGILLDVAHLAPEGIADLLGEVERAQAPAPVVSTHTGAFALTPHPRNLKDDQLQRLAATGGLAGITLYPPHVDTGRRPRPTLDDALDHAEHIAAVCGVLHVAVGADLDGFDPPGLPGADSPVCYGALAEGFAARGWSADDTAAVLGGNALRVLRSVLA